MVTLCFNMIEAIKIIFHNRFLLIIHSVRNCEQSRLKKSFTSAEDFHVEL